MFIFYLSEGVHLILLDDLGCDNFGFRYACIYLMLPHPGLREIKLCDHIYLVTNVQNTQRTIV